VLLVSFTFYWTTLTNCTTIFAVLKTRTRTRIRHCQSPALLLLPLPPITMARRSLTAMAFAASLTAATAFTTVRSPALSRFGAPSRASEPAMTMVASIGKATDPGVTQIVAESSTYDFVKASALEVLLLPRRSQPIATAPPPPPPPPRPRPAGRRP